MHLDTNDKRIEYLSNLISNLNGQIEDARNLVQQWTDANANLSRAASAARAENQNSGRGFLGALLGPKFRSTMRFAAASSNAAIAKEVADQRTKIAEGKRDAQASLKRLQSALVDAKQELKSIQSSRKSTFKNKSTVVQNTEDSIALLHKLKDAYDAGILTDSEYEAKRSKLIAKI